MTTEQVIQSNIDGFMDCFYGYLLAESNNEILPESIRDIFHELTENYSLNLAFHLEGLEEKYFADYTYFRSKEHAGEIYVVIPFGEIEIDKETWENLPDDEKEDWTLLNGFAYQELPAVTIVYRRQKLEELAKELKKDIIPGY